MTIDREQLLGLRLSDAQRIMRSLGCEPEIVISSAPHRTDTDGYTLRVVRVRGSQLTVCAFTDGIPGK